MPINITPLTSSTVLSETTLNDVFQKTEEFLNGGMTLADIDTSKEWVTEKHVVKPEFYGAPAPRTLLVSSDLHERKELELLRSFVVTNDMTTEYVAIPRLSATFFVHKQDQYSSNDTESQTDNIAIVNASWNCLESPSTFAVTNTALSGSAILTGNGEIEGDDFIVARFALFVNGQQVRHTVRNLYANYGTYAMKSHSISAMVQVNRGMNDVSIRVQPVGDTSTCRKYQIIVRQRSMNIEVLYR